MPPPYDKGDNDDVATFTIGVTPEPWEVLTYPGVFVALSFPESVVDAVPLDSSHINAGRKGNVLLIESQQASAAGAETRTEVKTASLRLQFRFRNAESADQVKRHVVVKRPAAAHDERASFGMDSHVMDRAREWNRRDLVPREFTRHGDLNIEILRGTWHRADAQNVEEADLLLMATIENPDVKPHIVQAPGICLKHCLRDDELEVSWLPPAAELEHGGAILLPGERAEFIVQIPRHAIGRADLRRLP